MPKARIPQVEIQLAGKTRHLIFNHHAMGELEERAAQLGAGANIKLVILTLWAGLLAETLDAKGRETEATLTPFQVASILDGMEDAEVEALKDKLLEARGISTPPENPTAAKSPEPASE